MRIGGIEVNGPPEGLLVLERPTYMIPIKTQAVMSLDEFERKCVEPKPPVKTTKSGDVLNFLDKGYISQKVNHARQKSAWIVIKTLEPSKIEWPSVDMEKPNTWVKYQDDLRNAGFSVFEINRIIALVEETNCLDESKLKWAREVFLQGQQQLQDE